MVKQMAKQMVKQTAHDLGDGTGAPPRVNPAIMAG